MDSSQVDEFGREVDMKRWLVALACVLHLDVLHRPANDLAIEVTGFGSVRDRQVQPGDVTTLAASPSVGGTASAGTTGMSPNAASFGSSSTAH